MGIVDTGESEQRITEDGKKSGHYSQRSGSQQGFGKQVSESSHSSSHTHGCSAVSPWLPLLHPFLNAAVPQGSVLTLFSLSTLSSPSITSPAPTILYNICMGVHGSTWTSPSGCRPTYRTAYLLLALDSSDISKRTSQPCTLDITLAHSPLFPNPFLL